MTESIDFRASTAEKLVIRHTITRNFMFFKFKTSRVINCIETDTGVYFRYEDGIPVHKPELLAILNSMVGEMIKYRKNKFLVKFYENESK